MLNPGRNIGQKKVMKKTRINDLPLKEASNLTKLIGIESGNASLYNNVITIKKFKTTSFNKVRIRTNFKGGVNVGVSALFRVTVYNHGGSHLKPNLIVIHFWMGAADVSFGEYAGFTTNNTVTVLLDDDGKACIDISFPDAASPNTYMIVEDLSMNQLGFTVGHIP